MTPPRKPLMLLTEAERIRRLQEMGLDENMLPLGLTPDEKKAAESPGLPDVNMEPLVSPKAAVISGAIGVVLGVVATVASVFLPQWAVFGISVLSAIALYLAGKALPGLKVKGALVPATAVPALLSAAAAIGALAGAMAPGKLQSGLLLAASVCAGLAGKAEPPAMVESKL